jgi:hypothetical protein
VGATPPKSLYKTPSPLLNILGVQKLLLYTTQLGTGIVPGQGKSRSIQSFLKFVDNFINR